MAEMQQAQAQRDAPTAFLSKLYRILETENNDLIAWTTDGTTFIVKDTVKFATDVLPRYFKTKKYGSFERQLGNYGFKRVDKDFYEYRHDSFRRGEKHLLLEINRTYSKKKTSAATNVSNVQLAATSSNSAQGQAVVSSTSVPEDGAPDSEIVRENKRLRQENEALKQEIHRVRTTLNYVAGTMKDLGGGGPQSAVPVDPEARG